jgi:hypothetical protein
MKKSIVIGSALALIALAAGLKLNNSRQAELKAASVSQNQQASGAIIPEESLPPSGEYQPIAESFQKIEGSLISLSEKELRQAAETVTVKLATQIEIAKSRALSEAEQSRLLADMRRQSAIYKMLAERGLERLRKRL